MRAFERVLSMCARLAEGGSGIAVVTAYGVGTVDNADGEQLRCAGGGNFVSVTFPAQSYGAACAAVDGCSSSSVRVSTRHAKLLCRGASDYALLEQDIASVVGLLLKQMAEKLDSVREAAGGVLARLLAGAHSCRHAMVVPEFAALQARLLEAEEEAGAAGKSSHPCLRARYPDLTLTPTNPLLGTAVGINWQKAEQVFPFLVRLLDCATYRKSILNGKSLLDRL